MNLGQVIGEMRMRAAGFEPDPYRKPLVAVIEGPRVTTYNEADKEPKPPVTRRRNGLIMEVEQFVRDADSPVSSRDVANSLGITDESAGMRLLFLFRRGAIERKRIGTGKQNSFGYYVKPLR